MRGSRGPRRILAIDPNARGFGFVVLEGADRLVDWGLRDVRRDRDRRTLDRVRELLDLYRPDVLVTEDIGVRDSRRRPRAQHLILQLHDLARSAGVRPHAVRRSRVHEAFGQLGATTKHAIARVIASRFPELLPHRPPFRKPWMSEDQRMAIFDAGAFAVASLHLRRGRPWVATPPLGGCVPKLTA